MKHSFFRFLSTALVLTASLTASEAITPKNTPLTFKYTRDQLEPFKQCPIPNEVITVDQLTQLDREVAYLVSTSKMAAIDATIFPSYLANTQKDFAWISYRLTGQYKGNLGPVTLWTARLFIPDATLPSVGEAAFDPYSSGIAALVVSKASDRLRADRDQIADYPIKKGEGLWEPTSPGYRGLNYGSAKTWFLNSSDEYVADAPPEENEEWEEECAEIEAAMEKRTGDQTQSVFYWASLTSPHDGKWSPLLEKYFDKHDTPLGMRLYARSLLESAMADSTAAAFHSKYTYWVQRPSQMDDSIQPLITVPNHPSYPSAHSTNAGTALVVLSELFPENEAEWKATAEESGMSRIYGGIHYPTDHTAGMKLGEQVGEAALERNRLPQ